MRLFAASLLAVVVGCSPQRGRSCDPGTHVGSDGNCAPDVSCGPDTVRTTAGVCVPTVDPPVTCGPGTQAVGSQCLPGGSGSAVGCGAGTHAVNGVCVVDGSCGPGMHAANGGCVADASCGPGTHLADGLCLADNTTGCGKGTHLDGLFCTPDTVCGSGTHQVDRVCLPDAAPMVICGPGTHQDDFTCVADTNTCGPGTHPVRGICTPNSTITCGPGTHDDNDKCVPDGTISCGDGTELVGNVCQAIGARCGPGTHDDGTGACVPIGPGGTYEVRAGVTKIDADGYTQVPLFVIGTNPDGTPSRANVVLATTVAGVGTLTPSSLVLDQFGTTVSFTPCSSAIHPKCPASFYVTLALASAPTTIVAVSPLISVVAPAAVGTRAQCPAGSNTIYFNGDAGDYVYSGIQTIPASAGRWQINGSAQQVSITMWSNNSGPVWSLDFDSYGLKQPLATQVYANALRFSDASHAGLDISGDGRGCNQVTGRFQIEDLAFDGSGRLTSFTATFEHHCEGKPPALNGCVHVEQ